MKGLNINELVSRNVSCKNSYNSKQIPAHINKSVYIEMQTNRSKSIKLINIGPDERGLKLKLIKYLKLLKIELLKIQGHR